MEKAGELISHVASAVSPTERAISLSAHILNVGGTVGNVIAINNEINNHFTDRSVGMMDGNGPGDPPSNIPVGTNSYYLQRADDFKRRYPNLKVPDYYLKYGNKNLIKFEYVTKQTLSDQGQKWLERAKTYLQILIEDKLHEDPTIETRNEDFTNFIFSTHEKAYVRAGILQLSIMDKVKILLTPNANDLFSDRGLKQFAEIAEDQAFYYSTHIGFTAKQALELAQDYKRILPMIHKYYIQNKQFFENTSKGPTPWGGNGGEHYVIETIFHVLRGKFYY